MKQNSKSRYNPHIHNRQSRRLKGYDYSQPGSYFITFCTQNRECLFGEIINGQMHLNDIGKMIETEWLNLKTRFTNIELHAYVIMPDHFHGIIPHQGLARPPGRAGCAHVLHQALPPCAA